jgi:hypothetical protein
VSPKKRPLTDRGSKEKKQKINTNSRENESEAATTSRLANEASRRRVGRAIETDVQRQQRQRVDATAHQAARNNETDVQRQNVKELTQPLIRLPETMKQTFSDKSG